MADILLADQRAILLMPRFGIKMGVGDKTVKQICQEQSIELDFFLLMVNIFLHPHYFPDKKLRKVDVNLLLLYLANAHDYYIREKIPAIRQLVEQFIQTITGPAKQQLNSFFHDYIRDVLEHIEYEEQEVFPYIRDLLLAAGQRQLLQVPENKGIDDFQERHSNIEEKLSDLKNLLVKYFPPGNDLYLRIRLLNELFDLEQDLVNHARLEDKVLIPVVKDIERNNSSR